MIDRTISSSDYRKGILAIQIIQPVLSAKVPFVRFDPVDSTILGNNLKGL